MAKKVSVVDVLLGCKKAIVGFVLAAAGAYVAKQGWTLDTTVGEVLNALPAGVVTGVAVWFSRNK